MRRNWILAALSLVVALGVAEAVLRISGFSFDMAPESVEFGSPKPRAIEAFYLPDPHLFWVPKSYYRDLAALEDAPPDLLFLGDSCTELGAYPRMFLERLQAANPDREIRGEALGVAGWSSHQGLAQLKRDVIALHPSVVTFYFGWNDHWIGFGIEDAEIGAMRSPTLPALGRPRLLQLVFKARIALRSNLDPPERVSLDDFRANLIEMARVSRRNDIVPVFLTAPTSHRVGREPEYLTRRHLRDLSELVPLHQRYVEAVREAAPAGGAVLCDLAAGFDALPEGDVRGVYFHGDGIHLRRKGDSVIAKLLEACFAGNEELSQLWPGVEEEEAS
ncbi:MAG: GDSL-type esterase/lipase family protein [Myxococcota bacterium]